MLRMAICDDDLAFMNSLKTKIDVWENKPFNSRISCFTDGDALVSTHKSTPFDIILLDIVMPLVNGIETAREIRAVDKEVKIVFLTSSSEYAVESYTVKANNYLLKPVKSEDLYSCLNELASEMNSSLRNIVIKCNDGIHKLLLDNIEYVEASNKHTVFALSDGRKLESIRAFNTYENDLLEYDFCKCHRSYLVNIHHIDSYTTSEIKTGSGSLIPISRNRHKDFESAYFSKMFEKAGEI